MDVEVVCAKILAMLERRPISLRALLEERRWEAPRGLLHALCLGVLRNYKLLVKALRYCGYRGLVRGGKVEGWLPMVAAYEAIFRRGFVPREKLLRFLDARVVSCLTRVDVEDVVAGLEPLEKLSTLYSIPRWVVEKLSRMLPHDRLVKVLKAFQTQTPIYVRFNRSKLSLEEALKLLEKLGFRAKPDPVLDDVVVVEEVEPGAITKLPPNLFYVQDRSAALVAHVAGDIDGLVLDLFSAPGGKAGHLLWRNNVAVIAMDLSLQRLCVEARLLNRQGVAHATSLIQADALKPPVRPGVFRLVLVDPDCSSIGRLGHSPETRLFLEQSGPRIVERLSRLQLEALRLALRLVSSNGLVVYSTCTLTLEENEMVISKALEDGIAELEEAKPWVGEPSPILPKTQRIYPDKGRCGGGFVAKLRRV